MSLRLYSATICVVLVVCTSAAQGPQRPQENPKAPLLLRAQPVRNKVPLGEPIYLRLTLENVGSRNVLVNRSFHLNYQVWLEVTGPGGKKEEWCGIIPAWAELPGDFVFLAPGAHVSGIVRATCAAQGKSWGYRFPVSGQYSIVASYSLTWPKTELRRIAGSALVVKGPVYAKPIQLTVVPAGEPHISNIPK
jgi:hypothetical protein